MATPVYAYGLVILPPPAVSRQLLELRRQHPVLAEEPPPHITVKAPFLFRCTGAWLVDILDGICSRFEPFEVELGGVGSFGTDVIYLRVAESPELRSLHLAVLEGLEGYVETLNGRYEGSDFVPHLTVASKLTQSDFKAARQLLRGGVPRCRFLVESLHLLRGQNRWDVTRSFPLGA